MEELMKRCTKCKEEKDLKNFGIDKVRKDGLNPYCKECLKKRHQETKEKNPEKLKEWRRRYNERNRMKILDYREKYYGENREEILRKEREKYHARKLERQKLSAIKRRNPEEREKARLRKKEWDERNPGKAVERVTKWKEKNPQKSAIHSLMLYAIRVGILQRKEACEVCGIPCKTHGHHEDYSKPLEVVWLCQLCHGARHRKYR
jgi:hypothetical protein